MAFKKGRIPWNKGKKIPSPSEETRLKLSISLKGKMAGENHPNYGKHLSPETRQKIANSHIGLKQTDDVMYIPKELHQSIPHRLDDVESMKRINVVAFNWLEASVI